MEKYSKKAESFINNYVLSKLGYDSISDDNIVEIVDYIIDNIINNFYNIIIRNWIIA